MGEMEDLKEKLEELEKDNAYLRKLLKGYEEIMKLHEKEIDNDESIIEMYEQMLEYERKEMKRINDTAKAYENASELGREELDAALKKVRDLELQNAELKKQKIESLNK
ncbi:MAG: hypothetical protein KBH06_00965 [Spirochaetes bacterium]|nr:hypothetical protein [Spirochaetota bacterium]MBP9021746.1 hypothetical protein [Spirochaetota bacterium]